MKPMTLTQEQIERFYHLGRWQDHRLTDYLDRHAQSTPDRVALVDRSGQLTYAELLTRVNSAAQALLDLGITAGDAVSIQLPNWWQFVVAHLALTRIGAVTNPCMTIFREWEMEFILGLTESVAIVVPGVFRKHDHAGMIGRLRDRLPKLRTVMVAGSEPPAGALSFEAVIDGVLPTAAVTASRPSPEDINTLMFTSGTTAEPKGVLHTHNTNLHGATVMIEALSMTADDVVMMSSPIAHATGLCYGVRLPLMLGARMVLQEQWDVEQACQLIEREKVTFSMGATPFVHGLVGFEGLARYDVSSLRHFICAGAPIPRELIRQAEERIPNCKVLAAYGLSESYAHTILRPDAPPEKFYTSDGSLANGMEGKNVDDAGNECPPGMPGEHCTKGASLFVGYYKRPEATAEAIDGEGWFRTGDICTFDEDGYLRVVGRKKDLIIRGGINISPGEIEDLLFTHPAVRQVAVIGLPDERLGERICAYVVPKEAATITFEDVTSFLRAQGLAIQKLPERLEVVEEFPMTPSGKIQKFKLREDVAAKVGGRFVIS
ncbi:MAG: AMP-binding protein [Chloroflexi bacterium]|nr:AMP-binding protein [Chloroflexota bacterium]